MRLSAVLGIYLALISCLALAQENFLVKDGRSDYTIVLPDQAIPAELTAAQELQTYLRDMSGAELKIVKASEFRQGDMLAVSFNAQLPAELRAEKFGTLADEELVMASHGKTLLLAGGRPRGTLYAVYEFLNRQGIRWYTPEYTKVPKLNAIQFPASRIQYCPPLRLRSYLQNNRPTPQWTARNRMNQFIVWSAPGVEYGGGYSQGPDMHTCWRMIPADVMTAHPEWCVEVNGKRELPAGTNHWGICFSNHEVCQMLIEKTLAFARENPALKVVWIGQNDGSPACTCKDCKAFTDAHGGKPSALVVRLVNDLADRMAKEMPDRLVKTLAYGWSSDPPAGMTLRDNAVVMFCAGGDYYKPLATDSGAKDIRERAAAWRKIAKNIEVYLYEFPTDCYWFPTPNLYVTASNIEWAYHAGIPNVYAQICGCATGDGAELVDLRAWVYARKLWNPNLPTQALVEEFCRDYYGPAAAVVLKAIAMTNTPVFDHNGKMRQLNQCPLKVSFLDPKVVREINQMIEKKHDSLTDEVYKQRLRYVWMPYLWADVWLGFTGPGTYKAANETWSVAMTDGQLRSRYGALCKQFMLEAGVSALKENRRLNPNTLMMDLMGVEFKACQLKNSNVEVVAVPELAGHIFEFTDAKLNFSLLKPYNEHLVWEYPLHGPWRDYVNDCYVRRYQIKDRTADQVVFEGRQGDFICRKTISLRNGVLKSTFSAEALTPTTAKIYPSPMLNMDKDVLGDYPTAWIEKKDGAWARTVLGEGVSMFYYVGTFDIKNATGRMVLASETRKEGIEIGFDPHQVESFLFEYDRYFHFLQLLPYSPSKKLAAGEAVSLELTMKIVGDVRRVKEKDSK